MLMVRGLSMKICFLKGMAMTKWVFAIATAGNGASFLCSDTQANSPKKDTPSPASPWNSLGFQKINSEKSLTHLP